MSSLSVPAPKCEPKLLPKWAATSTSSIDHPDWNYHPLFARVQRQRFRMMQSLLGDAHVSRLLDIGFGSGVFMPELAMRCDELHGIDPHPLVEQVRSRLAANGVTASLTRGSAELMPYPDNYFDAVVSVSAMEFVPDIDTACREINRVLVPGGMLAVVTPGNTPLWDLALRVLTRETPRIYGDRRRWLGPALCRHFRLVGQVQVPRVGGRLVRLYSGLRLRSF